MVLVLVCGCATDPNPVVSKKRFEGQNEEGD